MLLDCSGIRADDNGRMSSPEYPSNYTNNKQCVTIIRAPTGHAIGITFDSFLLEDGPNCNYDSLQIKTGMHESNFIS